MKISDTNVIRLAVLQHLRTVYGIKLKTALIFNDEFSAGTPFRRESLTKVFGVPLESVHTCALAEYGLVPSILVDACEHLSKYADTEGLFRISGSVIRLKSLKAKLDQGEDCLAAALPCDVASLVKQFFRELPDPIFPAELHQALLQAQQLPTTETRASATQLLSCLLPERNSATLRFLCSFLRRLSLRATTNKMTAYNLSLVFAPNLFHSDTGKKAAKGHDELRAAVTSTFIENAHQIGTIPEVVLKAVPSLQDASVLEEIDMDLRRKGRERSSAAVLPTIQVTPSSDGKRFSQPSKDGLQSTRKRKSKGRKSFCLGMLPRVLFNSGETAEEEDQPIGSAKASRCSSVYQKVRKAVRRSISCLSSSKQEEHRTKIPTDSQPSVAPTETPVWNPTGELQNPTAELQNPEATPRKSSSLSSLLKALCCGSNPGLLAEPEPHPSQTGGLTPDQYRVHMDAQNNNTPEVNPSVKGEESELPALILPSCDTPVGSVFDGRTPLGFNQEEEEVHLLEPSCGAAEPLLDTRRPRKPHAGRVAARVKIFSSLHLRSQTPKRVRTPLHFQRTPVLKYVKRMNSLIERGCIERGSYRGVALKH